MSTDPRLDRRPQPDARNAEYPIRALLADDQLLRLRSYTWRGGPVLDQGREGACVGFSWAGEAAARPVVIAEAGNDTYALEIYRRARQLDPWDGEDYSGTSVLAGAKAMVERGHAVEYRWGSGLEDLIAAVGYKGPAVLGIDWYEDSYDTDDQGFLRVSGAVVGGHAILLRGVRLKFLPGSSRTIDNLDLSASYGLLRNSWGVDFGQNGDAKIRLNDLQRLIDAPGADVCIPVRRK